MIVKTLAAAGLTAAAVVTPATAAWAPSPIATAWERQADLGYTPCKPKVSTLPLHLVAEGVAADADNGEQSGTCEIRMAWNLPDADLDWVAWHEVCHLSTVSAIYQTAEAGTLTDPAHQHGLFRQCLGFGPTETGGY